MHLPGRILLIACCFSFSLLARGQLISLSVEKQSLEKVLMLIEQQTEYRFIYSGEMMSAAKPVTAEFKNETLVKALDLCFKEQPLAWAISEKHIVLQFKKVGSQEKRLLRGRVVNEQGEGLAGISVMVKGTGKGTISNGTGMFELADVPDRFRLVVSGIQIEEAEIMVGTEDFVKVETRQKSSSLDQTVVVGYGTNKRRYLVESVGKVKGEDITKQPLGNPVLALAGRVAGLQITQSSGVPGSVVQVRLRGRNSMVNGNDPLFIIDGVPFPSSTLNDALGGPGGIATSPLDNINPSSIESIEILKDAAATAIYGSRGANGVVLITTRKGTSSTPQVTINAYTGFGRITRTVELVNNSNYLTMRREAFKNDNVTPTIANAPDLLMWDSTRTTDWQRELIGRQMRVSEINASVSVGSKLTRVLVSVGYRNEGSVFAGNFGAEKVSGSFNVNHTSLNGKFHLSMSASFLANESFMPKEDLTSHIRNAPNTPEVFTADGKLNWAASSWTNPYSRVLQTFTAKTRTWQSNLQASWRPMECIELRLGMGYTSLAQSDRSRVPLASLNPASGGAAQVGFGWKNVNTYIAESQLVFNPKLPLKHHTSILLGSSIQLSTTEGLYQMGNGYSSDELLGSLTAAQSISTLSELDIRYRYAAIFGRIQYDYDRKYLLTASIRRDGSSRYGPSNRFANFASLGLGWILSAEKWLKNATWLELAKLRISAGTTGNDQVGDYKYLDLYTPYTYTYQGLTTFYPAQLYSPGYSWEKVTKFEASVDISIFKQRLNLTTSYYHNTTTNQLVNYSLPASTGFSGIIRNIPATIRNTGWEVEIEGVPVRSKNFSWNVSFNVSVPRNKLVAFENFQASTYANTYAIGHPLNITRVYSWLGVDPVSGIHLFRDYNNDGRISAPADQSQIISTAVDFYGGVENTFTLGKWELSAHIFFSSQPQSRNYFAIFNKPGSLGSQPSTVMTRWTKPGDLTNVQLFSVTASAPNLAYNNVRLSDAAYSNASFIRLRNIRLSYVLPVCRIYVAAQNLLTITDYQGLDPETTTLLPPVRMLTGGVQFTF